MTTHAEEAENDVDTNDDDQMRDIDFSTSIKVRTLFDYKAVRKEEVCAFDKTFMTVERV